MSASDASANTHISAGCGTRPGLVNERSFKTGGSCQDSVVGSSLGLRSRGAAESAEESGRGAGGGINSRSEQGLREGPDVQASGGAAAVHGQNAARGDVGTLFGAKTPICGDQRQSSLAAGLRGAIPGEGAEDTDVRG